MLVKNRKFDQKSKCWLKTENLIKNRNFGQKSKLWSKIESWVKKINFGQKLKRLSLKFLVKIRNLGQK